jgi:hypothetical protein
MSLYGDKNMVAELPPIEIGTPSFKINIANAGANILIAVPVIM